MGQSTQSRAQPAEEPAEVSDTDSKQPELKASKNTPDFADQRR